MKGVVLLALAAFVASPAASASHGARVTMSASMSVTGEIGRLGVDRIAVGHVACAIPPALARSAGRFVIGDPVRMTCRNGKLSGVRYSPEVAQFQTTRPGGGNAPTTVTPPPTSPCGLPCATRLSYNVSTLFLGGGPTGDTVTATGPITDLSDGSLTAGGLTCSFRSGLSAFMNQAARVGDDVTLTCTGGVFTGMKSVGTISRSA